ncbi:MAG: chalcone isomerase family protein [Pseudomonadota bacterium]
MTTLPATNRALLALILASTLHAAALAAPTPTRFEPSVQVAGTKLQLNGTGTRFKAIFKVYDMALYTPRKVRTREELMALPGAMRMQFTALRELSTTDLGLLFLRGMAENTSRDLIEKHALSGSRLNEALSGRSKLNPGDTFTLDFIPGKGTQFYIQGQPQGTPVGDAEFFGMVLSIWFGPHPADRLLERSLLGHEKTAD